MAEPLKVNTGMARVFGEWRGGAPFGQTPATARDVIEQRDYMLPPSMKARLRVAANALLRRH